ncbi:copper chaperone PCu(A)C [Pseudomonas sp. G.S.17]|uniref:copper chaperone PCu(A)C n=1 Tax=Pseudomonas sp. G.S.17 TaxID=3137451 RepID=UPI00311CB614
MAFKINKTLSALALVQALALLPLMGIATQVCAQTVIEDAWVRATVPGQPSTGAFMTVTANADSKLVAALSPAAKLVQIHQSSMKDDVMIMQEVDSVTLPAGKPVVMAPSGYHVMLIDLVGQVQEGDEVPVTLVIEEANGHREMVKFQAKARALNTPDSDAMHDHGKMH